MLCLLGRIGAALDRKESGICHVDHLGRFWFFRLFSIVCVFFRYYPLMFLNGLDWIEILALISTRCSPRPLFDPPATTEEFEMREQIW